MALVSPGIQISVNDQSQYVNSSVGSVPLVVLATAQDKVYNNAIAAGTTKANAGKLMSFTSQRDLVTAMGTPSFKLSSAGTPINGGELNEYGLLASYSALGLGNRLYAIRADINLNELVGTSVRPTGTEADTTLWLDLGNTDFGIFELTNNSSSATTNFEHISPMLITDQTQVDDTTFGGFTVPVPKSSVGTVRDYALVFVTATGATPNSIRLFYKAPSLAYNNLGNSWVQVGSEDWQQSVPAMIGTNANPSITAGNGSDINCTINGAPIRLSSSDNTPEEFVAKINLAAIAGVKAVYANGYVMLFATDEAKSNGSRVDGKILLLDGAGHPLYNCGLVATQPAGSATGACPYLHYGNYASQPTGGWLSTDAVPRPTGSLWWKTSATGGGYAPVFKEYSASLDEWISHTAPMYAFTRTAIYNLDKTGGGINIEHHQIITTYAPADGTSNGIRFNEQLVAGQTIGTGTSPTNFDSGRDFTILASQPGSAEWYGTYLTTTATTSSDTADSFVADILSLEIPYVDARVNANGTISIIHTAGGQINIIDTDGAFDEAGFVAGANQYVSVAGSSITISNFLNETANVNYTAYTPYAAPADGTHWYYSDATEVDILINTGISGGGWKGYLQGGTDVRGYSLADTDPMGVIVSASQPKDGDRSDAGNLAAGDLWLDTSDLINYPALYRYTGSTWTAIDKTDHVSSNGIIFADARWDTNGSSDIVSDALPTIGGETGLVNSTYLDVDAPDYQLYPRGTLLFNTRRSGYNVKKFVKGYFNSTSFSAHTGPAKDAWVTVSGNREDGSMYAGSDAQRALVIAAMKSAVDSNTDALDANYQFNLLVAPGYPELIPNLVTLNDNRSSTGFVIGDTPMTLAPTATELTAWNSNANGDGLATASPYLAVYYPAGLTNDLAGNPVVVPASHAVLRTFLYNDNVSYQWFAPAGVHRGLIDNLSDIGYVNAQTGTFVHNGVNHGLRDTLYSMNINPITQLPGTGLVVWGQETRSGDSTARNRVNVVRLENYLRTIFNTIANSFLFEPNDTITRKTLATQIESACHDLLSKRGLYDFLVICDTSNNTPSIIANNQLYVDVAIEPMKDVEFIYIPIALYNPGTIATLGAAST